MKTPKSTPLRERMIEDLKLRNYAKNTRKVYIWHVEKLAKHFKQSPDGLGYNEIRQYLTHFREQEKCSLSHMKQAVGALRFFYKYTLGQEWIKDWLKYPRGIMKLPRAVSKEEIRAFLAEVKDEKCKTALTLMYASGLRLMEALTLKVSDINSKEMFIRVRDGKGSRERRALLSLNLLKLLRRYWKSYHPKEYLFEGRCKGRLGESVIQKACLAASKKCKASPPLCQTASLGGAMKECPECRHRELHYKSCYHRGCSTCEGSKDAKWMKDRADDLLPVHYFHVVFTVPHVLNDLFFQNQKIAFSLFFDAVKKTLVTVGKNRFGGEIGFFAVMHTWGQKLNFHPHLHCVVPGGALSPDLQQWISSSKKQPYFASHKVLALVFRGILIKKLKRAYDKGDLKFEKDLEQLLTESVNRKWVVHCKPPFDGPIKVIKYLARYTRKVAISNSRLLSFENHTVSFSWRDYANDGESKVATLPSVEFTRRFLTHIPLPRFVRIRHFGFLSNAKRKNTIPLIRELIGELLPESKALTFKDSFHHGGCPKCGTAILLIVSLILKEPFIRNST